MPSPGEIVEIISPRVNDSPIRAAESFLCAVSAGTPFSLEISADAATRRFLLRAEGQGLRYLLARLGAAYSQAGIRSLRASDPAQPGPDEQVIARALVLCRPPYLPLRIFRDDEIDADATGQADPALGLLHALGDLPPGWRSLSQIVLQPVPPDWCEGYRRMAVEHALASERAANGPSLVEVYLLGGLMLLAMLGLQAYLWFRAGNWSALAALVAGAVVLIPALVWLLIHVSRKPIYDERLVQQKIGSSAYLAQLRLAVFAPAGIPAEQVEQRVDAIVTAYRLFHLDSGNRFESRRLKEHGLNLSRLGPLPVCGWLPGAGNATAILNTWELAGLWHLPHGRADAPFLERTTARYWLPQPLTAAGACRIGVSVHQGREVPVSLPEDSLKRHMLLVAKTRRGKSSLMLLIARYLMQRGAGSLVLVDPHHDLARAALGAVPRDGQGRVVVLDVAEARRPFGLNLLDTGLGWDRDQAVSNILRIFEREFDRFWGPRMEDAFRYALHSLYAANERLCELDPDARGRQYTILDVPPLLSDYRFRRSVLDLVQDGTLRAWWSGYFDALDRRLQIEIINPVQTKVQRYAGSSAARHIVGQPRSTIHPSDWLASRTIVLVNTARGTVGEGTSSLIGGTLLNLVALTIARQADQEVADRHPITLCVDEFHTMVGADYEGILSELSKYGANLILATQSLARLAALDHDSRRALRSTVFANIDTLFAFHTSAEDAEYLVRELGGEVLAADLVEMGEHRCYVKLSAHRVRQPVFALDVDAPPTGDPEHSRELLAASAAAYGRDVTAVERDLQTALERIEATHRTQSVVPSVIVAPGSGAATQPQASAVAPARAKPRNEHRRAAKGQPPDAGQNHEPGAGGGDT